MFVEAHTVGQDDWTTLPDLNGHTSQAPGRRTRRGELPGGLARAPPVARPLPDVRRLQLRARPTGTTGAWNAATGRSSGWEQWSIDLSAYAGKQVEVSIAYASDWSVQGLGAFVDDTTLSTGAIDVVRGRSRRLGGDWPPPGSGPNANNWISHDLGRLPRGRRVSTPSSIYFGFGLEGIATPEARGTVMRRSLEYLLR